MSRPNYAETRATILITTYYEARENNSDMSQGIFFAYYSSGHFSPRLFDLALEELLQKNFVVGNTGDWTVSLDWIKMIEKFLSDTGYIMYSTPPDYGPERPWRPMANGFLEKMDVAKFNGCLGLS